RQPGGAGREREGRSGDRSRCLHLGRELAAGRTRRTEGGQNQRERERGRIELGGGSDRAGRGGEGLGRGGEGGARKEQARAPSTEAGLGGGGGVGGGDVDRAPGGIDPGTRHVLQRDFGLAARAADAALQHRVHRGRAGELEQRQARERKVPRRHL